MVLDEGVRELSLKGPRLASLIGELSLGSDVFRRLWADHNVTGRTRGRKEFAHPLIGELTLDYVAMRAPDDPDMTMMIYSAPAGSEADVSLRLLTSLSERPDAVDLTPDFAGRTSAE